MTEALRLVVVRHGATELTGRVFNGSGPGAADPGLTQAGTAQVRWARARLADIGAPTGCVVSPARRARQTAELLGYPDARVDPVLAEVDFGQWEGCSPAQVQAAQSEAGLRWLADPEVASPGGTSLATVAADLRTFVAWELREVPRELTVVGHASTVRVLTAMALGLDLAQATRLQAPPGVVAELRFWPDGGSCLDSLDHPLFGGCEGPPSG